MNNPFFEDGSLKLEASINKLKLFNVQHLIAADDIEGLAAFDIFSTELIINVIKENHEALGLQLENIPDKELPIHLNQCLESKSPTIQQTAVKIVEKFGKRLGVILYVLKRGKSEHPLERTDWNDQQWAYWQTIEHVVLTGGLSSGKMGEYFKSNIESLFAKTDVKPIHIILTNNSQNAGLIGASRYIKQTDGAHLVFDFGQSFVKRCIVRFQANTLVEIQPLQRLQSMHLEWSPDLSIRFEAESRLLHKYIQDVIMESLKEAEQMGYTIGSEIVISMANYITHCNFVNRGGYGKLALLSQNYELFLSQASPKKSAKSFKSS